MKKIFISVMICFLITTAAMIVLNACTHTHQWGEWTVVREATCTSKGRLERYCECGEKDLDRVPTLEHTHGDWIIDKEATLIECGKKHQVCSVCNTTINEEEIPIPTFDILPGITDMHQEMLRPNYGLANCRKLEGNPVVVLLFMDDDESHWNADEISTFTEEHILLGLNYLENNAKKWGVDLDFVVESHSTHLGAYELKYEGIVNTNLYVGGSSKDVLDQAAQDMGCDSNWELYSYYKSKYPNDDIIFLNFLNKSGISYTRHAISTGYLEYSEHCVIFADYWGFPPETRKYGSRAATVAHEILHLFGAEDFYSSSAREALANKLYPNDIMLWQYDDINDNLIGDYTAFSVGWTTMVPDVCFENKWWE